MAYRHSLTSSCLPDPLTHLTRTEKALEILDSAAVRSFDQLAQNNFDTLTEISILTPVRRYYPTHKKGMQTVEWCSMISFLSQHTRFYMAVEAIFNKAKQTSMFYPGSAVSIPDLPNIASELLDRNCIRSSTFRILGFGAEDHTDHHDVVYRARDRDHSSSRFQNAFMMSDFVYRRRTALHWNTPSDIASHLWDALSSVSVVYGPNNKLDPS